MPTLEELELFRQWVDAVQDLNPHFLEKKDYVLARKIYSTLGKKLPIYLKEGI